MKLNHKHAYIPGTERYTQPEEIKALGKYLREIKQVQEEHTTLQEDNLMVPGENKTSIDPNLPRIPKPLTSLPGHVLPVEGNTPEETQLEGGRETLGVTKEETQLEEYRENITDPYTPGLVNKALQITTPEDPSLEDLVLELSTGNDVALEDEVLKIQERKSINLENTKLNISPKDQELKPGIEKLKDQESPKTLENTLVGLSMDSENSISLSDVYENLEGVNEIRSLEDNLEELLEKIELDLEDQKEILEAPQLNLLENEVKILEDSSEKSLEETLEILETNKEEENLEEWKEVIYSNPLNSLEISFDKIPGESKFPKDLENKKEIIENPISLTLETNRLEIEDSKTPEIKENSISLIVEQKEQILSQKSIDISVEGERELENKEIKLPGQLSETSLETESVHLNGSSDDNISLQTEKISLTPPSQEPGLEDILIGLNEDELVTGLEERKVNLAHKDTFSDLPKNTIERPYGGEEVIELPGDIEIRPGEKIETSLGDKKVTLESSSQEPSLEDIILNLNKEEEIENLGEDKKDLPANTIEKSIEDTFQVSLRTGDREKFNLDVSKKRKGLTPEDAMKEYQLRKDFNLWVSEEKTGSENEYIGGKELSEKKILRPKEGDRTTGFFDRETTETIINPEEFSEEDGELRKKILRPENAGDEERTTTSTAKGFNSWFSGLSKEEQEDWIKKGTPILEEGKIIRPSHASGIDITTTKKASGFNPYHSGENGNSEPISTPDDFEKYQKVTSREFGVDDNKVILSKDKDTDRTLTSKDQGYKKVEEIGGEEDRIIRPENAGDEERTTTSTAKGFNSWFSGLSKEEQEDWIKKGTPILEEGKIIRPREENRTITSLSEKNGERNLEPIDTPEGFQEYIKNKKTTVSEGETKYKDGKVIIPNLASGGDLTSWDGNPLKYEDISEEKANRLDDRFKRAFSGNWGWKTDKEDIPHYKLPEMGWGNHWSGNALNPSTYLRWAAENTIGLLPLKGSAKQKVIDETLHFLVWGREALEKATKSNRDRLPGDDMGMVSDVVSGTNVKEAATKVVGTLGKILSKTAVDHSNPINRPSKGNKGQYWEAPGQEILDGEVSKKEGDKDKKASWTTITENTLIGGGTNNTSDWSKRYFTDYIFNSYKIGEGDEEIGVGVTLSDLIPRAEGVTNLEGFKTALRNSRFITTPEKFTSTKNSTNYMTLDSNHVWEIFFRPFVGPQNGYRTWLPSFLEIDFQNKEAFNYTTHYSRGWLPITGFELQEKKLTSKDLPLFDGSISYPVSMEFTNELRLTFADDSLKSLKRYFDLCAKVSAYMSNIHEPQVIRKEVEVKGENNTKTKMTNLSWNSGLSGFASIETIGGVNLSGGKYTKTDVIGVKTIYDDSIDTVQGILNPTVYLEGKIHPGLYKNLSFLVSLYVLTPQYGTIRKCNLLCVLKDFVIDHQGEIDSSPTELSVTFSIVGENPYVEEDYSIGKLNEGYEPPKKTGLTDRTGTGLLDNLGGVVSVF